MHNSLPYFKKNLKILQKASPPLAYQLERVDASDLELCHTQQKELNLRRLYQKQIYYYHSQSCALKEAQEWFQTLDLHLASVIFVYGVGLGYYYEAAQKWLKQHSHHTLIFLEEDLSVLFRLCETQLGSNLLKDPQVQLIFLEDEQSRYATFNELSWAYFKTPFVFSSLKLYHQLNPEGYSRLKHEICFRIEQKKVIADEYLQFGVVYYRNFYPNLLELTQSYWGNGLINHFRQVPAIICGAGPSLNKNMHLLLELKDRALIFAGGSALNALIPRGILPHFGVAIDPNFAQYARVSVAQSHHIPFFYHNRLHHQALTAIKGPRLYLTGEGGYPSSCWFEKQLGIEGQNLDTGHNVINFSVQIAQALGCNPIILIGTDLAFTDQEYYANGVAQNLNLTTEDLKIHGLDSPAILKTDIYGKPIYTLWKWISESRWFSNFAELHPELTILNATEGGLGFKGIPNLSLEEVKEKFLKFKKNEINTIDKKIQQYSLSHLTTQHILQVLLEMKESLDACISLFLKMIEENDRLIKQIQKEKFLPLNTQTPTMALLENDIEEQIGYQHLLDIFNSVFIRLNHHTLQDIQSSKKRISQKKRMLKKLDLEAQRFVFLRDVARLNGALIQHAIKEKNLSFLNR